MRLSSNRNRFSVTVLLIYLTQQMFSVSSSSVFYTNFFSHLRDFTSGVEMA